MHLAVKKEAEDVILGVLRHGCVDNMTSPGSTFPFSASECKEYISIFEGFRCSSIAAAQGYQNAVIARIWNAVGKLKRRSKSDSAIKKLLAILRSQLALGTSIVMG
ncbi:hypothetical protein FRB96_004126 [Tulasnella sp. 330]|nr:hypothetical protein FRB96_004126 [Tulasnella sp. 330]